MGELTEWFPAIIAGGLGILGGFIATFGLARKASKEEGMALSLVDLEERYNHAVALLKDLELYKTRMDPASYEEQRSRLETEAVDAMRERDHKAKELQTPKAQKQDSPKEAVSEEASAVIGFFQRRPEFKGFLWGLGLAVVGGGLYFSVQQESKPRQPMGEPAAAAPSAATRPAPSAESQAAQSRMGELLEILQNEPSNIDAMVELGGLLLRAQLLKEAKLVTDRTLQLAPDNLAALTHQAVLKSAEGQNDAAFDGLDYVLGKDPTFYKAWFFKGMLSMQANKSEQMKESFKAYIKHAPDSPRKERIKTMLAGGGIQMPAGHPSPGQVAPKRPMAPALGSGGTKRTDELKALLAKEPNNVEALVELGHLHLRVQDLQAAKAVTDQALALSPNNLEALTHAAVIKGGTGDSEGAFRGFDVCFGFANSHRCCQG